MGCHCLLRGQSRHSENTKKRKKQKNLSLKQTNEENAQRNEIKGQGKPLTFPCGQFGSKQKISLTYIPSANLYQFSSVAQLCPTLCNPMNRSTPGLPVHHQLPEFTQTHVHRTISSSVVPFSSCLQSFPASGSFQMSQLFPLDGQNTGVSASTSVLPMNTQH